jgi:hypothetical protein
VEQPAYRYLLNVVVSAHGRLLSHTAVLHAAEPIILRVPLLHVRRNHPHVWRPYPVHVFATSQRLQFFVAANCTCVAINVLLFLMNATCG